jgi:shikimate kinase
MNIVLTGMRGSGKSFYGRALAKFLNWKFVDTDELIVKKEGKSINEIVQKNGWHYFRKLEKELCKELANLDEHIIATGGGMIIDKENEELLRQNGKIIFLYRTIEKCAEYILQGTKAKTRPSLTDKNLNDPNEFLKELSETWQEREKRYRLSADLIIDVNTEVKPEEILEKLQEF